MIWDRFDDAMDGLDDEEEALDREIADFERQLQARGIDPGRWEAPDYRGSSRVFGGPHDTYLDRRHEVNAHIGRRDALRAMLVADGAEVRLDAATPSVPMSAARTAVSPSATGDPPDAKRTEAGRSRAPFGFWTFYLLSVIAAFAIGLVLGLSGV